ncbi:MAG: hypothetical protein H0S82_02155 [Anaerolineaceae bacterium]|nr:hypothetical protein [Anaerolineaceae bacterium]
MTGLGDDDHAQYLNEERHDTPDRHAIPGVVPHDPQKADDSTVVHNTGDESVAGIKTFSSLPVLPAGNPTSADQAASKGYVDRINKVVSVKNALFTGTQVVSLASSGEITISGLSISHALQAVGNKIILLGQVGIVALSNQLANVGVFFAVDGTKINVGDSDGSRSRVAAASFHPTQAQHNTFSHFITAVYEPGTLSSLVYTLRVMNTATTTQTAYVNRTEEDGDTTARQRGSSSLLLLEIAN